MYLDLWLFMSKAQFARKLNYMNICSGVTCLIHNASKHFSSEFYVLYMLCKNVQFSVSSFGPALRALIIMACFGCLTIKRLHINVCAASQYRAAQNNPSKH